MRVTRRKAHVATENRDSVCGEPGGVFAMDWWQSNCRVCREKEAPEPREVERGGHELLEHAIICEQCNRSMRLIVRRDGKGCFYGCTGYAKGRCKNTCSADDDGTPRGAVEIHPGGPLVTESDPKGEDEYPDSGRLFERG